MFIMTIKGGLIMLPNAHTLLDGLLYCSVFAKGFC